MSIEQLRSLRDCASRVFEDCPSADPKPGPESKLQSEFGHEMAQDGRKMGIFERFLGQLDFWTILKYFWVSFDFGGGSFERFLGHSERFLGQF